VKTCSVSTPQPNGKMGVRAINRPLSASIHAGISGYRTVVVGHQPGSSYDESDNDNNHRQGHESGDKVSREQHYRSFCKVLDGRQLRDFSLPKGAEIPWVSS